MIRRLIDIDDELDFFNLRQAGEHTYYGFMKTLRKESPEILLKVSKKEIDKILELAQAVMNYCKHCRTCDKKELNQLANADKKAYKNQYDLFVYLGEELAHAYQKDNNIINSLYSLFINEGVNPCEVIQEVIEKK